MEKQGHVAGVVQSRAGHDHDIWLQRLPPAPPPLPSSESLGSLAGDEPFSNVANGAFVGGAKLTVL